MLTLFMSYDEDLIEGKANLILFVTFISQIRIFILKRSQNLNLTFSANSILVLTNQF